MATLKAKHFLNGKNYAEIGENVLVSEDGEITTKRFIEDMNDGEPFLNLVDSVDGVVRFDVDDMVYEEAENLSELIESVVKNYEKNPPKTFEEDLNYEFNDGDPNEWTQYYEDADQSETNPS